MRVLEINERFAQYFDKLDYGQEQQLERSMKADLTSEPIVWWHNPEKDRDEILDGHNRYEIAKRCKLEPQFHEKHFETEDEALLWIIRNQTTRRNLVNRENVVRAAVELEIKIGNKGKTQAVEAVADQMGLAKSTIWESLRNRSSDTLNPVTAYKEARYSLEKTLTREKNKAVEAFKKQVISDGLDEDSAQDKWQQIEAEIDEQYAEEIAKVEALGEQAQYAVEDNPGLRNTGTKRSAKKSVRDRAARRNTVKKALSLIAKLDNEVFYFWDQVLADVPIDAVRACLREFQAELEAVQEADVKAAKKKKFGR